IRDRNVTGVQTCALPISTTLFVADKNNGAVRKLTSNGFGWAVSTAAGMPFQRGLMPGPLPTSLNAVARIARTPSGEIVILNENEIGRASCRESVKVSVVA